MRVFLSRGRVLAPDEKLKFILDGLARYVELEGLPGSFLNGIRLEKTQKGKPIFDKPGVKLSLSHTEGLVAAAFSESEIGVDVEKIRVGVDAERISARFFLEDEIRGIEDLRGFFDVWTAKEAYAKYTSEGVSSFNKFSIHQLPKDLTLIKLDVGCGYSAHAVSFDKTYEIIEYELF